MTLKAFITGVSGLRLLDEEKAFLKEVRPCGLIVFDRNIENRDQLKRLVADYREAVGSDQQFIMIDQEGGRIQRMRAPHWKVWPAGARYGELYKTSPAAAKLGAELVYQMMSEELLDVGINVNCVPLLDIPVPGAHDVIGDRALSDDLEAIIELGRCVARGNLNGGVLPVIKHIPGHGRATSDSHIALPTIEDTRDVLEQTDFKTFKALNDLPLAMTGHLLMTDLDPDLNVSVSRQIISEVIRGWIGFYGLLISDDLSMEALSGTIGERGHDVVEAGCDVALYCKGIFDQMVDVAASVPDLDGKARHRFDMAHDQIKPAVTYDIELAHDLLSRLQA
ncbi:MAG: glycoside hydrolase family 3 protein [bacterium]|nr:glycoside hydrolase family 3 protein [bacterium]